MGILRYPSEYLFYSEYYSKAKEAYDYVKSKMVIGASNKILDQPTGLLGLGRRRQCVASMRESTDKFRTDAEEKMLADRVAWATKKYGPPNAQGRYMAAPQIELEIDHQQRRHKLFGEYVQYIAMQAKVFGCGNCEEQSALVFQYLKDLSIRPLDWMQQGGIAGFEIGNHAFVILGRDIKTDPSKISTWNPEVVYCDPYENNLGGIDLIKSRFEGEEISLLYRWGDIT